MIIIMYWGSSIVFFLTQAIMLNSKIDEINKKVAHPAASKCLVAGVFVVILMLSATLGLVADNDINIDTLLDTIETSYRATRTSTLFGNNPCEGAKPNNLPMTLSITKIVSTLCRMPSSSRVSMSPGAILNKSTTRRLPRWRRHPSKLDFTPLMYTGILALSIFRRASTTTRAPAPLTFTQRTKATAASLQRARAWVSSAATTTRPTQSLPRRTIWEHCVDMVVGQTYEIHWPHSAAGACSIPFQFQTPFYDGVFCGLGDGSLVNKAGPNSWCQEFRK